MPGLPGSPTDFELKWNEELKQRLYGPEQEAVLDGEYIDSSEGYVTDELDFSRTHFSAALTPLCFAAESHTPAIFRGLVAHGYVQRMAADVHSMDRLMMANSTPIRLCWLAPHLDVLGMETNWHSNGRWQPMSDFDLLYRRSMCKGKPFCILMNTQFEQFSGELVEKYMQRALAYGMFPGFFSHNASQGHYFTRPELYNRDRPLFKKYIPLCRLVAQAGWEPITRATTSDSRVYIERFGEQLFTVFNSSDTLQAVTVHLEDTPIATCRELVHDRTLTVSNSSVSLEIGPEQVAVIAVENRAHLSELEAGFSHPPREARPSAYWLWINGYTNRDYFDKELGAFADIGVGGLCIFDMGARGDSRFFPPTGPAFMSNESVESIAQAAQAARRHGLEVQLSRLQQLGSGRILGGAGTREHGPLPY